MTSITRNAPVCVTARPCGPTYASSAETRWTSGAASAARRSSSSLASVTGGSTSSGPGSAGTTSSVSAARSAYGRALTFSIHSWIASGSSSSTPSALIDANSDFAIPKRDASCIAASNLGRTSASSASSW